LERRSLPATIQHFGSEADEESLSNQLFAYWRQPPVFPDAKAFLDQLARPVCIVSNIDRSDIEAAINHHNLTVDLLVTSEDARAYKPRAEPFHQDFAAADAGRRYRDHLTASGWQTGRVPDQQMLIRPARIDDNEDVWPLARDFATSFKPERAAFDATWRQLVGAPHTLLLVAEIPEHGIVGYLLGNSHLTFLANGPVAWVEELMVDGQTRRSGIGRHLMEHAEQWARSIGAPYLALASRRAGPFYLALDYEDSATFYKKTLT
jgi:GNAT superfamily N-acetyltransferase